MPNRLIHEQSHYLLQHAHNPVDWYPWGDEPFNKAKLENKPLIISIGYAACHWCHVMERESFENDEVAAYMNEHFVCVKVDREEHPDVDHMYMDAVQAISGSGGWPLNVFVTPGRVPFYGGTYYPPRPAYSRPSWMQLMGRMSQIWTHQHDEVEQQAGQMVNFLQQAAKGLNAKPATAPDKDTCIGIAASIMKLADKVKGGFGNAPKFPGTMAISYLLEHYHFTKNEDCLKQALRSLDAMAAGGIYDQLGGGFARYSTDAEWLAPHFEKMLYDNALLVGAYCDAYAVTKDEKYKVIIDETIAFVERELKHPSGGYYCALDADSEGVEGKFYTWEWDDFVAVLGAGAPFAAQYFGLKEEGNWEETNILHIAKTIEEVARENDMEVPVTQQKINAAKQKLFTARASRIRPLTDDKCLLSWNALMSSALTKAATTLGNNTYLEIAENHMQWMVGAYTQADGLKHTWKNGTPKIGAKLDDYAYLVKAMLGLASASGENGWITEASKLIEVVVADFSHEGLFFYYTPESQQDIPVRKVDLYDGATPSANSVMAYNLYICGICMENTEWIGRACQMLDNMAKDALRNGYSYGYWAQVLQQNIAGIKTVVCTGKNAHSSANTLGTHFLPNVFSLFLAKEGDFAPILKNKFSPDNLYIFVCSKDACSSPVSSVGQVIGVLG
jgi:uncharacterized protein YyaL (SSP411 family)